MRVRTLWMTFGIGVAASALQVTSVAAQITASERSTLTQQISGTEIVIDYARPSVRGRDPLFGGLVPWMEVWTPGANASTTFHFSKDVSLNGADVPAGTYSIWLQPREQEAWVLMLHADTTLFHLPHPSLDEAFMTVPVKPEDVPGFTETLAWKLDHVRADGAELQFRWGNTLVPVALGVDPGYVLTMEAEEAARYVGVWAVDQSMARPPDSLVAIWKADASEKEVAEIDAFLATMVEDVELRLEYEEATGRLVAYDVMTAAAFDQDPGQPMHLLLPKAEGVFNTGGLMNGELAFVFEQNFWEFDFDDDGVAQVLVQRGPPGDRMMGRGIRVDARR